MNLSQVLRLCVDRIKTGRRCALVQRTWTAWTCTCFSVRHILSYLVTPDPTWSNLIQPYSKHSHAKTTLEFFPEWCCVVLPTSNPCFGTQRFVKASVNLLLLQSETWTSFVKQSMLYVGVTKKQLHGVSTVDPSSGMFDPGDSDGERSSIPSESHSRGRIPQRCRSSQEHRAGRQEHRLGHRAHRLGHPGPLPAPLRVPRRVHHLEIASWHSCWIRRYPQITSPIHVGRSPGGLRKAKTEVTPLTLDIKIYQNRYFLQLTAYQLSIAHFRRYPNASEEKFDEQTSPACHFCLREDVSQRCQKEWGRPHQTKVTQCVQHRTLSQGPRKARPKIETRCFNLRWLMQAIFQPGWACIFSQIFFRGNHYHFGLCLLGEQKVCKGMRRISRVNQAEPEFGSTGCNHKEMDCMPASGS